MTKMAHGKINLGRVVQERIFSCYEFIQNRNGIKQTEITVMLEQTCLLGRHTFTTMVSFIKIPLNILFKSKESNKLFSNIYLETLKESVSRPVKLSQFQSKTRLAD